jgi:hypothetical protein
LLLRLFSQWHSGCAEWDELSQYYFGTQGTHRTQSRHYGNSSNGIGRVTIRRDGMASLAHHGETPGSVVVTQPFLLPSCGVGLDVVLMVNVKTAAGGSMRVGLADATGDLDLQRFAPAASDAIAGDFVRAVASWRGSSALTELSRSVVTMSLHLKRADLYAWEWRCVKPSAM